MLHTAHRGLMTADALSPSFVERLRSQNPPPCLAQPSVPKRLWQSEAIFSFLPVFFSYIFSYICVSVQAQASGIWASETIFCFSNRRQLLNRVYWMAQNPGGKELWFNFECQPIVQTAKWPNPRVGKGFSLDLIILLSLIMPAKYQLLFGC